LHLLLVAVELFHVCILFKLLDVFQVPDLFVHLCLTLLIDDHLLQVGALGFFDC